MKKQLRWGAWLALLLMVSACAPAANLPDETARPDLGEGEFSPMPPQPDPEKEAGESGAEKIPPSPPAPEQAQPSPESGPRESAYPERYVVVEDSSTAGQKALRVSGMLPTPCHRARYAAAPPDAQNHLYIDLYSLSDPEQICVQMLAPFEVDIPLGVLPPGDYTVWVNGELAKELQLSR